MADNMRNFVGADGANLPGIESPAQQIALLESMVAEMHQEMRTKDQTIEQLEFAVEEMERQMATAPVGSRVVVDAGMAEQFSSFENEMSQLRAERDEQVTVAARLEEALMTTNRTMQARVDEAAEQVQHWQAVAKEQDAKVELLKTSLDEVLSQTSQQASARELSEAAENYLERALEGEERALHLTAVVEEKSLIISRLEAELVQAKQAAAGAADSSPRALQALVGAKDQQIAELEHLLDDMHKQASERRAPSMSPEDDALNLKSLFAEKDEQIRQLSEDLAGAVKKAEIAEVGRRDLRKELASSADEVVRLQVALDGKDLQLAQIVEGEKRASGAHRTAIESEVTRLQTFISEKDRLIEQLMAAVAMNKTEGGVGSGDIVQLTESFEQEVQNLTKRFEEERAALSSQMEQENGELRNQVKDLQRENETAVTERDALSMELRQVVTQYEKRLAAGNSPAAAGGSSPAGTGRENQLGRSPSRTKVQPVSEKALADMRAPQLGQGPTVVKPQTPRRVKASYTASSPITKTKPLASPPSSIRVASPMREVVGATQRAASPPATMRFASPARGRTGEAQFGASPPATMRFASPPREHFEMAAAIRCASPPRAFAAQGPQVQMRVPLMLPQSQGAQQRAASPMAGGSVTIAATRKGGGSLVPPPSGSVPYGQGGSMNLRPGASASAPAAGGSVVMPVGMKGFMQPAGSGLLGLAVASPPRSSQQLTEDATAQQRAVSPIQVRQVVTSPPLLMSQVPSWAMQQKPQQVDNGSKYLLSASSFGRQSAGDGNALSASYSRMGSSPGTNTVMDTSRDASYIPLPRSETVGSEGSSVPAKSAVAH